MKTKPKEKKLKKEPAEVGLVFSPNMFKVPEEDTVSAVLPSRGRHVFRVVPASLPKIRELRATFVAWKTDLHVLIREFRHDPLLLETKTAEKQNEAVKTLIKATVLPELDDEQAEQLTYHSGGRSGDLAFSLTGYYGLGDILPFAILRGGDFDNLPI